MRIAGVPIVLFCRSRFDLFIKAGVLVFHHQAVVVHDDAIRLGGTVYVHCAAGISRSSTITCAYLMSRLDCPFERALNFLQRRRSIVLQAPAIDAIRPSACPNDGFREQLLRFENSDLRRALNKVLPRVQAQTKLFRKLVSRRTRFRPSNATGPQRFKPEGSRF